MIFSASPNSESDEALIRFKVTEGTLSPGVSVPYGLPYKDLHRALLGRQDMPCAVRAHAAVKRAAPEMTEKGVPAMPHLAKVSGNGLGAFCAAGRF